MGGAESYPVILSTTVLPFVQHLTVLWDERPWRRYVLLPSAILIYLLTFTVEYTDMENDDNVMEFLLQH